MSSIARYASTSYSVISPANSNTSSVKPSNISLDYISSWIRVNLHLFIQIVLFVLIVSMLSVHISSQRNIENISAYESKPAGVEAKTFDELSSSEVAAVVGLTTQTIVSDEVVSMAEEVDAGEAVTATSDDFLSKPAVAVTNDASSKGITTYTVAEQDTIASIASKFAVSEDTVLWANNINASGVKPGVNLSIPPVSGVVYTVNAGDTPESIASKFNADASSVVAFNDAEINGLQSGQKIVIPGGVISAPAAAPAPTPRSRVFAAAAQVNANVPATGNANNGYAYGYCTWGVANLVGVPRMWGNANRWDDSARASGFRVDKVPSVGAIAQTDAGWGGHVGLVIGVEGDKIIMKDMNGPAGFGRYGVGTYSAGNYNYIHL